MRLLFFSLIDTNVILLSCFYRLIGSSKDKEKTLEISYKESRNDTFFITLRVKYETQWSERLFTVLSDAIPLMFAIIYMDK
jgi:hypothetical protein